MHKFIIAFIAATLAVGVLFSGITISGADGQSLPAATHVATTAHITSN